MTSYQNLRGSTSSHRSRCDTGQVRNGFVKHAARQGDGGSHDHVVDQIRVKTREFR